MDGTNKSPAGSHKKVDTEMDQSQHALIRKQVRRPLDYLDSLQYVSKRNYDYIYIQLNYEFN